jgi:tetratricopeptide (TPR) repeat protein
VRSGRVGNYLEVINSLAPDAFREAVSQLADLAARELYINDRPVPKAKILEDAETEFIKARDLYKKLDVRPSNLYEAIMALRSSQIRLKWIEPKPDFYKEANELEQQAQKTLDDRVADLTSSAHLEKQTGRLEEALQKYRQVVDILPDRNDPRHRNARDAVLDLTRLIEQKKGSKKK